MVAETFDLIDDLAEKTFPRTPVVGVATHPEDDLVIVAAVDAKADSLVSGDHDLLRIGTYADVRLVTARQFVEFLDIR